MNIMKNGSYAIKAMVVLTIVAFSTLSFSSCKETTGTVADTTNGTTSTENGVGGFSGPELPIAYINVDSLVVNYEYAKDMNERLKKKMEDMRVQLNQKGNKLQKDVEEFYKKAQNNAFLSEDRARQEQARLQKQEQELGQTKERLENEWMLDQHNENMQLADSVRNAVKIYNEIGKFQVVFNMKELDNIILANPKYDITQEVLTLLNSRYKPTEKK